MGKNDWRKKQEAEGGKTISVTLTPEASAALEELKKRLKSSQANIVSRVLVWGLKEVEAGKKASSDKETATQEDASRVTHEQAVPTSLEARLTEIEMRLAKVETATMFGSTDHTAI